MIISGEHLTTFKMFSHKKYHSKLERERNLLKLLKNMYENPCANILKVEPEYLLPRSEQVKMRVSSHLFCPISYWRSQSAQWSRKGKDTYIGKEEMTLLYLQKTCPLQKILIDSP